MKTLSVERGTVTYRRRPGVLRQVAGDLGRTEGGVNQEIHGYQGVVKRLKRLLEKLVAFGGHVQARRIADDLRAVAYQQNPPPDVPASWNLAQEADASEDMAELAYQLERTPQNRERLIRWKEKAQQREDALLLLLYAEREAEKRS